MRPFPDPCAHRGYVLTPAAGGRWMAQHIDSGDVPVSALPDGTTAVIVWRSRGALMAAIDRTYLPPDQETHPCSTP